MSASCFLPYATLRGRSSSRKKSDEVQVQEQERRAREKSKSYAPCLGKAMILKRSSLQPSTSLCMAPCQAVESPACSSAAAARSPGRQPSTLKSLKFQTSSDARRMLRLSLRLIRASRGHVTSNFVNSGFMSMVRWALNIIKPSSSFPRSKRVGLINLQPPADVRYYRLSTSHSSVRVRTPKF